MAQQVLWRLEEVERLDHQDDAGSLRQRQRPFKVFDDDVELLLTRECACVVADQAVHAQARHPLCERDRFSELLAPLLTPGRVVREAARALADVAGVHVVQRDAQAQLLDRAGDLVQVLAARPEEFDGVEAGSGRLLQACDERQFAPQH